MAYSEEAAAKKEANRQRQIRKRKKDNEINDPVTRDTTVDNTKESGSGYPSNGAPADSNDSDHQSPWTAHGKAAPGDEEDGEDRSAQTQRDYRDRKINAANLKGAFLINCGAAEKFALDAVKYNGPLDDEVREGCRRARDAFEKLAAKLERDHG
jgi:hypothetical protein